MHKRRKETKWISLNDAAQLTEPHVGARRLREYAKTGRLVNRRGETAIKLHSGYWIVPADFFIKDWQVNRRQKGRNSRELGIHIEDNSEPKTG